MKRAGATHGAQAGLVLAHGRGADAADILGLFARAGLEGVAAVAPEAPGRSWWPTSFLASAEDMEPHVLHALDAMEAGVRLLEAEGLTRNRIWLGGFSQGACLALETFARRGEGLAGVLAFSGGLIGTADAGGGARIELYGHGEKRFDDYGRRDGAQAWISVHERDPHIPLARAVRSAEVLRALGVGVELTVYPGAGHSVLAQDLAALRRLVSAPGG